MDLDTNGILQSLENRSILVTGAAGFLAKVFIEKILRVQPNVKKLYLLLRAADSKSATQRLNSEILGKALFGVVKEKCGPNWSSLIAQKVTVVAGDITKEHLGVEDTNLLQEMWKNVDVVVNLAATTKFDERYDVSMGINTMGAKHVLNFAKNCETIKVLLHVSTAYVSAEKDGVMRESACRMGETLNGTAGLDIENEKRIIEEKLKQLRLHNTPDQDINLAMQDLGIQRARKFGWPNTYVFTKAMGEMLLGESKANIRVAIVRPTIIMSTWKEPFPGWVEGIRTIDSLAVGYAKGRITCFLGDPEAIIDIIPADMVVNAMIVAMIAHANNEACEETIYHVGSSATNPCSYSSIQDYGRRYFTKHPWVDKEGNVVKVGKIPILTTMDSFHSYMALHYLLPLKGLKILNAAFCQYFSGLYHNLYGKVKYVMRMIDLYAPYLFCKGVYDDMNTEILRRATGENGANKMFYFNPKDVNWDDYFLNIHLPGVVKYVFK